MQIKLLLFRITYGFRIEIYDRKEKAVLTLEASDKKNDIKVDKAHYATIAAPVSTSIPQIRSDFTERFSNGRRYLEAAGRRFDQPTHHARKIMLLTELVVYRDNDPALTRDCSYYEVNAMTEVYG